MEIKTIDLTLRDSYNQHIIPFKVLEKFHPNCIGSFLHIHMIDQTLLTSVNVCFHIGGVGLIKTTKQPFSLHKRMLLHLANENFLHYFHVIKLPNG